MFENKKSSFTEPVLTARGLEERVEYWHTHETNDTLQEFLGMSREEYQLWLTKGDDALPEIISRREKSIQKKSVMVLCAYCGQPFTNSRQMVRLPDGLLVCQSCYHAMHSRVRHSVHNP